MTMTVDTHPKTPFQDNTIQSLLDICRKLGVSPWVLDKIKKDLHYSEPITYPDGTGNPLKDLNEIEWKINPDLLNNPPSYQKSILTQQV